MGFDERLNTYVFFVERARACLSDKTENIAQKIAFYSKKFIKNTLYMFSMEHFNKLSTLLLKQ